jgi:tetratricopeptide (TPR) repeat protein
LHYDLGLALKLKDKLPEATAEFRKAEELDPQQADVHYTLGVTLWQQGDFPAAVEELRAAIRAKPDYAEACYTLGTVLKQQGKLDEAASSLREAIRLQPDFAGAHTTLAAVLRQLGDSQGAAAESKAGVEISKQKTDQQAALFATNSGKRLLSAGDLDGAISQFRSAIGATPDYAPAHFELGLALQQKGDKEEALKEFQKAAELDPRLNAPR